MDETNNWTRIKNYRRKVAELMITSNFRHN